MSVANLLKIMADGKEEGKKEEVRKPTMTATAPPLQPLAPHFMVEGDIRQSVLRCVEHFLSRSYLEGDPTLVSQMNSDLYVPLQLLVTSKLIPVFGDLEMNLVISSIQESTEVSLDESRTLVRPNFKLVRTTIILRDLTGVNEEDVRKFFVSDAVQFSPTAVVKEVGDNWFVSFSTEPEAHEALGFIRKQKHNDQPIFARLKQESLLRTSSVAPIPLSVPSSILPSTIPSPWESFNPFEQPNETVEYASHWDQVDEKDPGHRGSKGDRRGNRPYQRKGREANNGEEKRSSDLRNRGNRRGGEGSRGTVHGAGTNLGGNRKLNSNISAKRTSGSSSSSPSAPINLGPSNFPPLHSSPQRAEDSEKHVSEISFPPVRPPLPDYRAVVSSKPKQEHPKAEVPVAKKDSVNLKDANEKTHPKETKVVKQDAKPHSSGSSDFIVPRQKKKKGQASSRGNRPENSHAHDQKVEQPSHTDEHLDGAAASGPKTSPRLNIPSQTEDHIHHPIHESSSSSSSDIQSQPSSDAPAPSPAPSPQHAAEQSVVHSESQLSADQKKLSWASLASKPPAHK